jgi:peptidoglycan/xylan/chitin deacetylase (PgdA/CDA1 family)
MNLILAYRRIACDGGRYSVSPDNFRQQLEVLRTHARLVSLAQLVRQRSTNDETETRVAMTFDDGYGDNVTHALPLLRYCGSPATFFIVNEHVGGRREFWWDELEWLLFQANSGKDRRGANRR